MTLLTRVELFGRSLVRKYFAHKTMSAPDYDPYDREQCESTAERLFAELQNEPPNGALENCRQILAIIAVSYPSEKLTAAYFSNLELILQDLPRLETPGDLVIGLGPGRSGSTSLSAMLGTGPNSCCTHESPPLIFWDPLDEQLDFHIRRFHLLRSRYSLVADVSHWWLNSMGRVFDEFPEARAIGLIRDTEECALSFMRVQGSGKGSWNPWATHGNGVWRAGHWDPTYPSYPVPDRAEARPDAAKLELITRYVAEYNARLAEAARSAPSRIRLFRTNDLGKQSIQEQIYDFAGITGQIAAWKLNVKGTSQGRKMQIKF